MSNFAANTDTRTARTRADERGFITFFRLIVMDNNPHILGTERIGKLLLQYSIPAIIGMTITSLYNIIDSIFIGHGVGAMGIAGLAITFPLMNLVVAFCTLVSAGGSTISSIRLGQKDLDGATEVLGNTLMFCLINAVVFGGLAFLFLDEILRFFGASQDTLPYARDFMQIILAGTPITYTMIGLNNIMRATGYPKKAMLTSMVTVVCNIIQHFHRSRCGCNGYCRIGHYFSADESCGSILYIGVGRWIYNLIHPFGAERFGWSYRGIGKYADVLSDQCCCFRRTRLFVFG